MRDPEQRKNWIRVLTTALVVILIAAGLVIVGFFVLLSFAMASYGSSK